MGTVYYYLFKDDKYVEYAYGNGLNGVTKGYPRNIADDWQGLTEARFDKDISAAVRVLNGHVYFFKDNEYVDYDVHNDRVSKGPDQIANKWPALKKLGFDCDIDAVVGWSDNWLYFFKNDDYVSWNITMNAVLGPEKISKKWKGLDADIDSAVNDWHGHAYFFQGSTYRKCREDGVDSTSYPITKYWLGMDAAGFSSGIQAGVSLMQKKQTCDG